MNNIQSNTNNDIIISITKILHNSVWSHNIDQRSIAVDRLRTMMEFENVKKKNLKVTTDGVITTLRLTYQFAVEI